jgi:DNA invertase Pin-like site-specific DNA recombinase
MNTATATQPIVAYLRVSTEGQKESGLGLAGQAYALEKYRQGVDGRVLATYTETESGKRADNRPELQKAIAHAKRSGAVLVIAALDRLARNVHFISGVMESGVDFVACDNPYATPLTIHILAAIAEDEAKRISSRTKAALQALKAKGVKLGAANPKCRQLSTADKMKGTAKSASLRTQQAKDAYSDLLPRMRLWRGQGWTFQRIADELNAEGQTTSTGRKWGQVQVMRVLKRDNWQQFVDHRPSDDRGVFLTTIEGLTVAVAEGVRTS